MSEFEDPACTQESGFLCPKFVCQYHNSLVKHNEHQIETCLEAARMSAQQSFHEDISEKISEFRNTQVTPWINAIGCKEETKQYLLDPQETNLRNSEIDWSTILQNWKECSLNEVRNKQITKVIDLKILTKFFFCKTCRVKDT
jgi:hypothetical protein